MLRFLLRYTQVSSQAAGHPNGIRISAPSNGADPVTTDTRSSEAVVPEPLQRAVDQCSTEIAAELQVHPPHYDAPITSGFDQQGAQTINNNSHAHSNVEESPNLDIYLYKNADAGRSRIPGFISWLRDNYGWFELFYNHDQTHSEMDDIIKLIDSPCRSWKTVIRNITESTVDMKNYAVCRGHMCYASLNEAADVTKCGMCDIEKPSADAIRANESVSYIPLVP